jgi:hypothetical protein
MVVQVETFRTGDVVELVDAVPERKELAAGQRASAPWLLAAPDLGGPEGRA